MKNNSTISSINLSLNFLYGVRGVGLIAKILEINKALTSINLSSNRLGTEEIELIAKALESNYTITSIKGLDKRLNATVDIDMKLQRNKIIKDISESFKSITSKITLDTGHSVTFF